MPNNLPSKSVITLGTEAEFLNLDRNGHIRNLNNRVLKAGDIVGTDGHSDTVEIRTIPSTSALDQFDKVGRAISKYFIALKRADPGYLDGLRDR